MFTHSCTNITHCCLTSVKRWVLIPLCQFSCLETRKRMKKVISMSASLTELVPVSKSVNLFIYLGFYRTFNTVQVISRWEIGRAEETSTYSWSRFCTVNCTPLEVAPGTKPRSQRWEARVLPLCHRGPPKVSQSWGFTSTSTARVILTQVCSICQLQESKLH